MKQMNKRIKKGEQRKEKKTVKQDTLLVMKRSEYGFGLLPVNANRFLPARKPSLDSTIERPPSGLMVAASIMAIGVFSWVMVLSFCGCEASSGEVVTLVKVVIVVVIVGGLFDLIRRKR